MFSHIKKRPRLIQEGEPDNHSLDRNCSPQAVNFVRTVAYLQIASDILAKEIAESVRNTAGQIAEERDVSTASLAVGRNLLIVQLLLLGY